MTCVASPQVKTIHTIFIVRLIVINSSWLNVPLVRGSQDAGSRNLAITLSAGDCTDMIATS